jgi:outer membrane protein TolC
LRLAREILLPQSRQAWESALAAYQGGKGAFAEALDAYRGELAAQEECETALVALLTAQADLEEAAGMDLQALAAKAGGKAP